MPDSGFLARFPTPPRVEATPPLAPDTPTLRSKSADVSIPESRSLPELLELASSEIPLEELSEAARPRSQRARSLPGVLLSERVVTLNSPLLIGESRRERRLGCR